MNLAWHSWSWWPGLSCSIVDLFTDTHWNTQCTFTLQGPANLVFPAPPPQTEPWFLRQRPRSHFFSRCPPRSHSTPSFPCPLLARSSHSCPDDLSYLISVYCHDFIKPLLLWAGTILISSEVFTILCVGLLFSKNSQLNMKVVLSFPPSTSSLLHGYLSVSQTLLSPPGWGGRSECSQFHCFSPLILLWL